MPALLPPPTFHGKPILMQFGPLVHRSPIVIASVHALVLRMEDTDATEDELLIRIHDLAAEYGLVTRLVSRTAEAIEFRVARQ